MTSNLKAELKGIEAEKKLKQLIDGLRWSERGKAELLELLLDTYEWSETEAVKEVLDGPLRDQGLELIQSESNRWKGFWHG